METAGIVKFNFPLSEHTLGQIAYFLKELVALGRQDIFRVGDVPFPDKSGGCVGILEQVGGYRKESAEKGACEFLALIHVRGFTPRQQRLGAD